MEQRIACLEAAEAVRGVFVQYTHYVDGRMFDELARIFSEHPSSSRKTSPEASPPAR